MKVSGSIPDKTYMIIMLDYMYATFNMSMYTFWEDLGFIKCIKWYYSQYYGPVNQLYIFLKKYIKFEIPKR